MFRKIAFLLPVCASVAAGCMSAPDLSDATGAEHSEIMIKDVVQRVKCEVSQAFDDKVEQREFLWLASWTAHADLTLAIDDTSGVAPNGSYTNYLGHSATSASKTPLASVTDAFSLGASASLNGSATRSETVSFTIALDELKRWRRQLDKKEANLPPEKKTCYFNGATGVNGNLGLKEWVDSAFYPVQNGDLYAGIHPYGGGGKQAGGTQGPGGGGARAQAKAEVLLSRKIIVDAEKNWEKEIGDLQKETKDTFASIDQNDSDLTATNKDLKTKLSTLKDSKYDAVLDPHLKQSYNQGKSSLDKISQYVQGNEASQKNCKAFETLLSDAANKLKDLQTALATPGTEDVPLPLERAYNALSKAMEAIQAKDRLTNTLDFAQQADKCSKQLAKIAAEAKMTADALPDKIDPPIDFVLHSLTFVVTYGGGISPSWSLLQWKGPGATGSLLSATGTRTHTLNLALAPRATASQQAAGGSGINSDALRLINNQAIQSLRQ